MSYKLVFTQAGLTKIKNAELNANKVELTQFAVGDGVISDLDNQTDIISSKYRANLNDINIIHDTTNFDLVIPSEVGGFYIREVALYDVDGTCICVGTIPVTYKVNADEGASKAVHIRVSTKTSNVNSLNLGFDNKAVFATIKYVNDELSKKSDKGHNHDDRYSSKSHSHSWNTITGKPSSFPPSSHNHDDRYALKNHDHQYNVDDSWFRRNADNADVKLYGNSRQMNFRTDGVNGGLGHKGHPFRWSYGGDSSSNTSMLLSNSGNIWTKSYGWLHDKFLFKNENAFSSSKLSNARRITLSGDTSGQVDFDGSKNVTLTAVVKDNSHNHSIGNITGLSQAMDSKAPKTHNHGNQDPRHATLLGKLNLNDIKTPGFYFQNSNANTAGKNYPEHQAGSLLVQNSAGITQIYTLYGSQKKMYIRGFYNNYWNAWKQVTDADWANIRGKPSTFPPSSHNHGETNSAVSNTIVKRDNSADIHARLFKSNFQEQTSTPITSAQICFRNNMSNDNYMRFMSSGAFKNWLKAIGVAITDTNTNTWRNISSSLTGSRSDVSASEKAVSILNNNKLEMIDMYKLFNITTFPKERRFSDIYDYMSSRNEGSGYSSHTKYNIQRAWKDGIIRDSGGGMANITSHSNSTWNYKFMYQLKRHESLAKGMKIKVPANTDVISVKVHHDANVILSVHGPTNFQNCAVYASGKRKMMFTGGYGHSQGVGAFGDKDVEHYHGAVHIPIPRTTRETEYILATGYHNTTKPYWNDGAWVSGMAFIRNPNLFATAYGHNYMYGHNGGDATNSFHGEEAENNVVDIPAGKKKTIKVPVAPNNPDGFSKGRTIYMLQFGLNYEHNNRELYVMVNGNKYYFSAAKDPISNDILQNATVTGFKNFAVVSFTIEDLKNTNLITHGGYLDVTISNENYNDGLAFAEVGTYIPLKDIKL